MSRLIKKTFKIDGMHCTSCAMNIDFDLEDLGGIKSAKTSYAKQTSEIEFDETEIKLPEIIKQIQKTGYVAKLEEK